MGAQMASTHNGNWQMADSDASVWQRLRRRSFGEIIATVLRTLFHPLVRYNERLVWEARLQRPPEPAQWKQGEQLIIVEPANIDEVLNTGLLQFLGGPAAAGELVGVRKGDRLFVVKDDQQYLAYSYVFFPSTAETQRQVRILDEAPGTPVIGMSYTAPSARGRGLYRRILMEMFRYMHERGVARAVCEVHPQNTPSNRASQAAGMQVCRQLTDWTILTHLVVQRSRASAGTRWRALWV
jgi:ribosomal protein S18 acetylase RimI-like enzyme